MMLWSFYPIFFLPYLQYDIYIYPKFTNFAPVKYWWLEDDRFLKWGFPGVLPSPPLIDPNPCCDLCVIQTCTKKVEIVRNVRNVHLQTSHVFPKMWRHLVIFGQLKPTFMKWKPKFFVAFVGCTELVHRGAFVVAYDIYDSPLLIQFN